MMKKHICIGVLALTGCVPMPGTVMNVGSDSTTNVPDTQTQSDNKAPVFHVTISPSIVMSGRDGTLSDTIADAAEEKAEEVAEKALAEKEDPLVLKAEDIPVPVEQFDTPINKSGEQILVGPQWGGATVDQFNMATCSQVVEEHRVEPVDPVWEGCRVYWDR